MSSLEDRKVIDVFFGYPVSEDDRCIICGSRFSKSDRGDIGCYKPWIDGRFWHISCSLASIKGFSSLIDDSYINIKRVKKGSNVIYAPYIILRDKDINVIRYIKSAFGGSTLKIGHAYYHRIEGKKRILDFVSKISRIEHKKKKIFNYLSKSLAKDRLSSDEWEDIKHKIYMMKCVKIEKVK